MADLLSRFRLKQRFANSSSSRQRLFHLASLEPVLLRNRARFHVLDTSAPLFYVLVQNLVDLPLFFFAGVRQTLFHGGHLFDGCLAQTPDGKVSGASACSRWGTWRGCR